MGITKLSTRSQLTQAGQGTLGDSAHLDQINSQKLDNLTLQGSCWGRQPAATTDGAGGPSARTG